MTAGEQTQSEDYTEGFSAGIKYAIQVSIVALRKAGIRELTPAGHKALMSAADGFAAQLAQADAEAEAEAEGEE